MHIVVHAMKTVHAIEIHNLALLKFTPWTWFYLLKHTDAFYPISTTIIYLVILLFTHDLCHWNTFCFFLHFPLLLYTPLKYIFFHSAIHTIPITVAIYPTRIYFLSSLLIPLLLLFALLKNLFFHSSYSPYCCYLHYCNTVHNFPTFYLLYL